MRTILSFFLITLFSFGLMIHEASAKRFGGGRSFGVQRSSSSYSSPAAKPSIAGKPSTGSRWGGFLGGMLLGGLLGSLFMGNGLASGLLSWLLIGGLIFLVISLFRRKFQPNFAGSNTQNFSGLNNLKDKFTQGFQNQTGNQAYRPYQESTSNAANSSYTNSSYNPDFNETEFLRQAKVTFMRLQAAYDTKNLNDLKEFTSPEVLAEIQMQFQERETAENKTDVISLDAQLLDAPNDSNALTATVRFTGSVKENEAPAENIDEIWHFRQANGQGTWLVYGVQQNSMYH